MAIDGAECVISGLFVQRIRRRNWFVRVNSLSDVCRSRNRCKTEFILFLRIVLIRFTPSNNWFLKFILIDLMAHVNCRFIVEIYDTVFYKNTYLWRSWECGRARHYVHVDSSKMFSVIVRVFITGRDLLDVMAHPLFYLWSRIISSQIRSNLVIPSFFHKRHFNTDRRDFKRCCRDAKLTRNVIWDEINSDTVGGEFDSKVALADVKEFRWKRSNIAIIDYALLTCVFFNDNHINLHT